MLSSDEHASALRMGLLFARGQGSPQMVNQDGIDRFEMQPGADGVLGSPGGGKTTLDFAYLHRAIKQHGLEVLDLTEAQQISPASNGAAGRYRIWARDLRSGQVRDHYADHVIVAAGTVNTLDLLLRSRAASGGLRGMERLGQRFFANGDLSYVCRLPAGRSAQPSIPFDGMIKCKAAVRPLGNRPWPFLVFGALPTAGVPLPDFVKRRVMKGILIVGMGKDESGTVYLKQNRLVVDYDPRRSPIYSDIREASAKVAGELGGRLLGSGRPTTAHPTGGASMGDSETDAVVGLNGEVFGHPGIYVCDAAALPFPVGGPPSVTIGAWAEHVAETFIARHGTQATLRHQP
jgi:cholesterol oxidase